MRPPPGPPGVAAAPPPPLHPRERARRISALHDLLAEEDLDALILASNDYRGHKGALRWTTDYNLCHRYGYAVVARGREPELVLPLNLSMGRPGAWAVPTRFSRHTAAGLRDALAELPSPRRVGIVGLNQVMRVEEYLFLREALPDVELLDASLAFERVRARKSEDELAGVYEAAHIVDRCFARLLEIVRPGITERSIGAEMYRCGYALGGEDPLFLTMYATAAGDGRATGRFGPPGDRVLHSGDLHIFSFELVGPTGYWVELSRMVVLGHPTELQRRMNAAVRAGMDAAAATMRPGRRPDEVQRAALDAIDGHGARSSYWSGHGLGQDVIEEPWIGLEVVQDRDAPSDWTLEERMVLALHPFVTDVDEQGIGYMSNAYIVGPEGGRPASEVPLELQVIA